MVEPAMIDFAGRVFRGYFYPDKVNTAYPTSPSTALAPATRIQHALPGTEDLRKLYTDVQYTPNSPSVSHTATPDTPRATMTRESTVASDSLEPTNHHERQHAEVRSRDALDESEDEDYISDEYERTKQINIARRKKLEAELHARWASLNKEISMGPLSKRRRRGQKSKEDTTANPPVSSSSSGYVFPYLKISRQFNLKIQPYWQYRRYE